MAHAPDKVKITVEGENGSEVLELTRKDYVALRAAVKKAEKNQEWSDEINDILDKGKVVKTAGTLNTMGDGWGWTSN